MTPISGMHRSKSNRGTAQTVYREKVVRPASVRFRDRSAKAEGAVGERETKIGVVSTIAPIKSLFRLTKINAMQFQLNS